MGRSHRHDRDACEGGGERGRDAAKERPAGLETEDDREEREHARPMEDDLRRIDASDLRDEGEEAVPERECVAGMQSAVGELVRALEREIVEREELLDAGEVEEPVAADLAGDAPEEDPETGAEGQREPPAAHTVHPGSPADRERERDQAGHEHENEGERERSRDDEGHRHRAEDQEERPGDSRRDARHPERPRDDEAGREDDRGREREPQEQPGFGHDVGDRPRWGLSPATLTGSVLSGDRPWVGPAPPAEN